MFVLSSCNYLDIVPTGKVIPEKVTEFRALLTNGYSAFPKYKYLLSLRSDEVMPIVGDSYYMDYIDFAIWQDNSPNTTVNYPWSNPYKVKKVDAPYVVFLCKSVEKCRKSGENYV